ncbi:outer membrane beta-barrel protein [Winogradskyella sp.]|uniref:outer membrane beta-barrel protein n=1 Tax=Winogradskyella sp. TaxID=1883156 RepID=UPI003F6A8741
MKKFNLLVLATFLCVISTNAQDDSSSSTEPAFGIKTGYTSITLRVSADGNSASDDVSGFYIGAFAEFNLSDNLDFQPELTYASYSQDGESTGVMFLPLLAKYKANEQFSLLAGPQFDYLVNEEDSEGFNRIGNWCSHWSCF